MDGGDTNVPMPDQTSQYRTREIILYVQYFTFGLGPRFQKQHLIQTLQVHVFEVTKSRTSAYHPQCDGMVEHFNRTLL